MTTVRDAPHNPLPAFARASALHVGAAAAAASLRHELLDDSSLRDVDFDAAYAVARLTPGTNLLALYALLGHRLGGWWLAIQAVALGAAVPACIVLALAVLSSMTHPLAAKAMQGARAGGLAVFLAAIVRLARPQLARSRVRGVVVAIGSLVAVALLPLHPIPVLLGAAVVGTLLLR